MAAAFISTGLLNGAVTDLDAKNSAPVFLIDALPKRKLWKCNQNLQEVPL
jgi:hypothetical protein